MIKAYIFAILLSGISIYSFGMEQVVPEKVQGGAKIEVSVSQDQQSFLDKLPADLQRVLLTNLAADSLVKATNNIKSLASVNKYYHDFINREGTMLFIIKTLANTIPGIDEFDVVEKLKTMPGIQKPVVQQWIEKRKTELPLEYELHAAIGRQDIPKIKELLAQGVNPNHGGKFDHTPLIQAALLKNKEVVLLLLNASADPNLESKSSIGGSALFAAAQEGDENIIALLLTAKANPNILDKKGKISPLLMAAEKGHTKIARMLIQADANVNHQNSQGYTPLMWATFTANKDLVKMLLDAKANVNAIDAENNTALIWAVFANSGYDIMEMLLKAGANPDIVSKKYGTALQLAQKKYDEKYAEAIQYLGPSVEIHSTEIPLLIRYGAK